MPRDQHHYTPYPCDIAAGRRFSQRFWTPRARRGGTNRTADMEDDMVEAAFIALGTGFFAVALLYVLACERL